MKTIISFLIAASLLCVVASLCRADDVKPVAADLAAQVAALSVKVDALTVKVDALTKQQTATAPATDQSDDLVLIGPNTYCHRKDLAYFQSGACSCAACSLGGACTSGQCGMAGCQGVGYAQYYAPYYGGMSGAYSGGSCANGSCSSSGRGFFRRR